MKESHPIPEELIGKINNERDRHAGSRRILWPRWVRAELLKLYDVGVSTTELERASGISGSVIYKWSRKRTLKRLREAKPAPVLKFKELRVSPPPVAELRVRIGSADIFGLTVKALGELLQETGQLSR